MSKSSRRRHRPFYRLSLGALSLVILAISLEIGAQIVPLTEAMAKSDILSELMASGIIIASLIAIFLLIWAMLALSKKKYRRSER